MKDRLPDGLTYADSATPFEYNYTDGTYYYWNFTGVQPQTSIEITFVADVEDCGDYNNTVEVIGSYEDYEVHDEDYAVVHVPCECEPGVSVDKKIWDEETGSWVDDLLVDEYPVDVRFNITIENIGTCDLINITVEDTLECGLGGARNFSIEPDDVGAGYIVWYFDGPLASSEKIFIEFEATALTNTANNVTVKANSSDDETQVSDSDTVTISLSQGAPVLSFSPSSYDFGSMMAGGTGSTTFEIWNNGGGQLNYTLSETCDWVSVSPLSGNSSGEHDVITVSIDTTDLSEGTLYTCDVSISSNGGSGTFTVQVYIMEEQQPIPPTVEIVKPEKNKLYFRDKPVIRILRTIIIGPVTIEANATDDGYIWKVEFFIDDTLKYTDYSAPYSWLWNETVFGKHTIKVKAYDDDGLTAEDELNVTIFNFGFGSVEEKGTVKGKVTEAGKMIKKGIPGVLVTASDGSNTTTGKIPFISRGKYSLQLSPGVYDITFEADGYVTYVEEDVEVTAGDTITLDIELEPACEGCE
ncbi:MAG TPA: hypothetical protein ENI42_03855 [Thermoplasmatales archaeon]|nr:hypothetical protein [Thermoplasmatales archaeon]